VPETSWPAWTAPVALVGGLVLAAVGGLIVDLPAAAFGAHITTSHTPQGIVIANTFVQDLAFVVAAVYCARIGGRAVHAWQLGLRPPRIAWRGAAARALVLLVAFGLLSVAWAAIVEPKPEKVLDQLGTGPVSALLVCIVAPMCEEILFRGFIFNALRRWRGIVAAAVLDGLLFGAVHAGSAPVLDLVPLAALGLGLCLLYARTGSLYPSMGAHSLNNAVAFSSLAGLSVGEGIGLAVAGPLGIAAVITVCKGVGLIAPEAGSAGAQA
jgi:membrane protease YdiL (CAAX protease family)